MKDLENLRRGIAVAAVAVAGLSVAALSIVGIAEQADLAAQRDVTLVSAADNAALSVVDAQVGSDPASPPSDVVVQENAFSWVLEPISGRELDWADGSLLFAGSPDEAADILSAGYLVQFAGADAAGQGQILAELDQLVSADQALDLDGDVTLLVPQLVDGLSGFGIFADATSDPEVAQLIDPGELAILALEDEVSQTIWGDFFGVFSVADVTP